MCQPNKTRSTKYSKMKENSKVNKMKWNKLSTTCDKNTVLLAAVQS